ncbi:MAG: hypothetical protein KDC87_07835 [Planctomycetes bacterium]|nr:hypothetical protein [Planctomycetota bacterium]
MFAESVLFNLVLFTAGQVVAYLSLRTGRRVRGLALLMGAWVLADIALLQRFAFGRADWVFYTALLAWQLWSLFELIAFITARIRRSRPSTLLRREALYRAGFTHYLRDELPEAIANFRQILRRDPWDVPAALALGTASARAGDLSGARTWLRTARALDVDGEFTDAIGDEISRLLGAASNPPEPDPEPAPPTPEAQRPAEARKRGRQRIRSSR